MSVVMHYYIWRKLTLKHTQSEKGKVTITKSQEIPVRRIPQMPTRVPPVSSAVKRKGLFDRNKTEKRCLIFRLAKNQYSVSKSFTIQIFEELQQCNFLA